MLLLKKKRYQEQLLDKTENQISNLERMVSKALGCSRVGLPLDPLEFHPNWQVLAGVQPSVQGQMSPKLYMCHGFPWRHSMVCLESAASLLNMWLGNC